MYDCEIQILDGQKEAVHTDCQDKIKVLRISICLKIVSGWILLKDTGAISKWSRAYVRSGLWFESQIQISAKACDFFREWWTKLEPYCLLQHVTINSYSWMITANSIWTYICFEKVHSGCMTKDQCTWVAILRIMEWLRGPGARMPWLWFPRMKG